MENTTGGSTTGQKVLIIEDDAEAAAALETELKEAGFSVQWAPNGETALAMVRNFAPDIVLLDLVIPSPNGLEVGRRLRQSPATSDIRIVVMTATHGTDIEMALSNIGIYQILYKPFSLATMVNKVKSCFRQAA